MTDHDRQAFGAWLQRERELAEVSQTQVATAADIHVVQLSRIENGHSGVKRDTLKSLIDAINAKSTGHKISLRVAFNKAGFAIPEDLEMDEDGLFSALDKLTPEMQTIAKRQIRAIIDSLVAQEEPDKTKL